MRMGDLDRWGADPRLEANISPSISPTRSSSYLWRPLPVAYAEYAPAGGQHVASV